MRVTSLKIVAGSLFAAAAVASGSSDSHAVKGNEGSLICPDMDLSNCYPKYFTPSEEWQVIKPGQIVPEGLHYRMDFETGLKEAKLLNESESSENSNSLVMVTEGETPKNVVSHNVKDDIIERINDTVEDEASKFDNSISFLRSVFARSTASQANSVIDKHIDEIDKALDNVIYSAHDLKYGEKFTADNTNVVEFFTVINDASVKNVNLKEKLLRIIGASIRNNPKSLDNIIDNNSGNNQLFKSLVKFVNLELSETSDKLFRNQILIKRVIGIFNALIYNERGLAYFEESKVKDFLNSRFNVLKDDTKERCIDLFNDFDMLIRERDRTEL